MATPFGGGFSQQDFSVLRASCTGISPKVRIVLDLWCLARFFVGYSSHRIRFFQDTCSKVSPLQLFSSIL